MKKVHVSTKGKEYIAINIPYDSELIRKVKSLGNVRWVAEKKFWLVPYEEGKLKQIKQLFDSEDLIISDFSGSRGNNKPGYKVLKNVLSELKLKNYSVRTIKAYLNHINHYLDYIGGNPEKEDENKVREYLLYLVDHKQVSRAYHDQAVSSIKFLYENVMEQPKAVMNIPRPKKEQKLPTVLNRNEIIKIFNCVENQKHKAILMLTYSAGLRVSEVVSLKLRDIDTHRKMIHIRGAKGKKDRYTVLSDVALAAIKAYLNVYKVSDFLFPGQKTDSCLTTRSVEQGM